MKVLAKRYNRYTRQLTDIIYLEKDRVCWLMKSWGLDPDTLWQANLSILKGFKYSTWEELTKFLSSKSEEGYGYVTIAKTYDY